ncbi:MAG: hypothetical protein ABI614_20000 [Planctomycetota bacterium]
MATSSFWADGLNEHRRAVEQQILALRKRLEDCEPDDRQQFFEGIDRAVEDLKKCGDSQILW